MRPYPIAKSVIQLGFNFAVSKGEIDFYIADGRHSFIEFLRKYIKEYSHTNKLYYNTLQYPVLRKKPFSLQELARSNIRKTALSFDGISQLELPEKLKKFLKEHKYMECSLEMSDSASSDSNIICTDWNSDSSDWSSDSSDWSSDSGGDDNDDN